MASNQTDVLSYLLQSFLLLLILSAQQEISDGCEQQTPWDRGFKSFSSVQNIVATEKKTITYSFWATHSVLFVFLLTYHPSSLKPLNVFCLDLSPLFFFLHFYPLKKGIFFCVVRDFIKALLNLQVILPNTFFFVSSWQKCPKNIWSRMLVPKFFKLLFLEFTGNNSRANQMLEGKYFFLKYLVKKWFKKTPQCFETIYMATDTIFFSVHLQMISDPKVRLFFRK